MSDDYLGFGSGFVYTINIIVGAGFLGIPYAFASAGVVLSLIYLFLASVFNYYLTLMFLEVVHKAKLIQKWNEEGNVLDFHVTDLLLTNQTINITETSDVKHIRFDVSRIFAIIFGKAIGIIYLVWFTIVIGGIITSYSSIFASSFASLVPIFSLKACNIYTEGHFSDCSYNYWTFLAIYAAIVMFFIIKGLVEQRSFQILMCSLRVGIISIVLVTCFCLMYSHSDIDSDKQVHPDPPLFRPENTMSCLPVLIFALFFQVCFPSIAIHVKHKRRNLWRIVVAVSVTIFICYGLLGAVTPFAIEKIREQVSLNYENYTGGYSEQAFWSYAISYIVVLFPAFDVASSYPIIAISIADNWKSMLYGDEKIGEGKWIMIKTIIGGLPLLFAVFFYDIVRVM
jgi:amino acid permease